uniref:Uncharacterized protein n=1 Tax=Lotus japonicus TaxID=34305 RepID=I3SFU9_LOTJA|nr:unknown [Lotus japonicus]
MLSKHNGLGQCPNKRADIAGLPVENDIDPSDLMTQILAIQEQRKQKVDHDVEQAKDQENDLTTLVADGTGKQHGAPDFGATDIRRLTTKLTDAEQERDKLAEKVGILEEEVVSLKTKCSTAEAFATSAAAAFEEKKKEAEILLEKNESAESSLEAKKKEVDNLKSLLLRAAEGTFDNAVNQLRILNPGLNIEGAASNRVAREGQICHVKEGKFIPCPDVHPPE